MRKLLYTALLALTIIGCTKPQMDDNGSNINTVTDISSTTTTTTHEAETITLIDTFDDGKGNITRTYQVADFGDTKIIAALVDGEQQHWFFGGQDTFQVNGDSTFELITYEYETVNYRGNEILVESGFEPDYTQLDDALDLSRNNWVTDKIYVFGDLGNFGYAGLAREGEFIVSFTGFETHVMLHENGHNYDFANPTYAQLLDPLYHLVYDTGYYLGPIAEYRAEMFARYYLFVTELPQMLYEQLELILG